jgi:hypothetical protein
MISIVINIGTNLAGFDVKEGFVKTLLNTVNTMRQTKILSAVLGRISRLFKLGGRSMPNYDVAKLNYPSAKSEDELSNIPYLPGSREIQVVEIDQVEFVREWSRTIVEEASILAIKSPEGGLEVDRRLPNFDRRLSDFDRRHPNHDRRMGVAHDRRNRLLMADTHTLPGGVRNQLKK